ncbi:MAG TPA: hypothetical protein VJH03_17140 [Blastocatellia bacterium]|nr:hypothetical protein [Blastocatellia bacterium]
MRSNRIWVLGLVSVALAIASIGTVTTRAAANEVRLRVQLAGATINGMTPKGKAEFRSRNNTNQFTVQVENMNFPDGTVFNVAVNGQPLSQQITIALLRGGFQLNTNDGDVVPAIGLGATVVVTDQAGATVLAGSF